MESDDYALVVVYKIWRLGLYRNVLFTISLEGEFVDDVSGQIVAIHYEILVHFEFVCGLGEHLIPLLPVICASLRSDSRFGGDLRGQVSL